MVSWGWLTSTTAQMMRDGSSDNDNDHIASENGHSNSSNNNCINCSSNTGEDDGPAVSPDLDTLPERHSQTAAEVVRQEVRDPPTLTGKDGDKLKGTRAGRAGMVRRRASGHRDSTHAYIYYS
jgi:hypothetical protein